MVTLYVYYVCVGDSKVDDDYVDIDQHDEYVDPGELMIGAGGGGGGEGSSSAGESLPPTSPSTPFDLFKPLPSEFQKGQSKLLPPWTHAYTHSASSKTLNMGANMNYVGVTMIHMHSCTCMINQCLLNIIYLYLRKLHVSTFYRTRLYVVDVLVQPKYIPQITTH